MPVEKKHKPLQVCSVCQSLSNERHDLNHRCGEVLNGRRCSGTYKSALTFLWEQCDSCASTGAVGSVPCAECRGFGWRIYG